MSFQKPAAPSRLRRPLALTAVVGLALVSAACSQNSNSLLKPLAQNQSGATSSGDRSNLAKATDYWRKQFQKNPQDLKAALSYARNLKAGGDKRSAFSVLQQASLFHGRNPELASEYGRLALEFGQTKLAARMLDAAGAMGQSDWKLISAQGAAKAKMGKFAEAIQLFEKARAQAPNEASVTNNLAMAHVANGDLQKGEQLLRKIALAPNATPRMRQNLSLVLGLQGRYTEAKAIAAQDAPTSQAYARIDKVQKMVRKPGTNRAPLSLRSSNTAQPASGNRRIAGR